MSYGFPAHPNTRKPSVASEWTTAQADCVARAYGIDPLTEVHWRVISECREEWAANGKVPEPEQLAARARLSLAELRSLFPPGRVELAWILAGVAVPTNLSSTFDSLPDTAMPIVDPKSRERERLPHSMKVPTPHSNTKEKP